MFASNLCCSEATDGSRWPAGETEFGIDSEVLIGLGEHHRRPDLYRLDLVRRLRLNAVRREGLLQANALGDQHHLDHEVCRRTLQADRQTATENVHGELAVCPRRIVKHICISPQTSTLMARHQTDVLHCMLSAPLGLRNPPANSTHIRQQCQCQR